MSERDDRPILIGIADSEVEANIWRDALAQEGIRVFVKAADPLAPIGVPSLGGGYEVYVTVRDEKRARWVLGESYEPTGPAGEDTLSEEREQTASRD